MRMNLLLCRTGVLTALLAASSSAWSVCNVNSDETGATGVVDLQGQGNFTCAQISGDNDACLNSSCSMVPVPGFQYQIGSAGARKFVTWTAPEQVDKVYVTASGQGSRCLYDFEPGAKAGSFLEPAKAASSTTVVACYDGVDETPPPEPELPISTTTNCANALPGLQSSLAADGNILTFIGIGVDKGLNGESDADDDYVLAVCAAQGQVECVDECRTPTSATFTCTAGVGEACLNDRACATSSEIPTGRETAPKYCWELSHDVDLVNGTFTPPTEKQSGNASWEQYEGSTCVKVTTTYRGVAYSYYTPTGCR